MKIKITAICFDLCITLYNDVSARYIPQKWSHGNVSFFREVSIIFFLYVVV